MTDICQLLSRIMPNNWLFFNQQCALCLADSGKWALCQPCLHDLPAPTNPCYQCGIELPPGTQGLCAQCSQHPGPISRFFAAYHYQPPLDQLIQGLKYHADFSISRTLGQQLAQTLSPHLTTRPDRLLPVPLHTSRLQSRGFNQAAEIARALGRALQIPVDQRLAQRLRATPSQARLTASERQKNMAGAFAAQAERVSGLHIAIVDDVFTTGATTGSLARTLLEAGAKQVDLIVLARTPEPGRVSMAPAQRPAP